MNLDQWNSVVCRAGFFGGFAVLALVILEEIATLLDTSLLGHAYTSSGLLEFAVALFIVVVALLLRQIREELKKPR